MKNTKINYFIAVVLTIIVTVLSIAGLNSAAIAYTNGQNEKYLPLYKNGERGISSPWYRNGLHIVDEGFVEELKVIRENESIVSLGSSLSVISFSQEAVSAEGDKKYSFLVCGNGSLRSDEILYALAKKEQAIGNDDIVKLEVSYSTFRDSDTSITETTVDKWGKYSIDEDSLVIKENSPVLAPVYELNLMLLKIQNMWELLSDTVDQSYKKSRGALGYDSVVPGNYRNNYFNYELLNDDIDMSEENQARLKALIENISDNNRLIIEISPLNPVLSQKENGQKFCEYVDNILIPYLEEKGIDYIDFRDSFLEEEFADGVHLGYDAGIRYTKELEEKLK